MVANRPSTVKRHPTVKRQPTCNSSSCMTNKIVWTSCQMSHSNLYWNIYFIICVPNVKKNMTADAKLHRDTLVSYLDKRARERERENMLHFRDEPQLPWDRTEVVWQKSWQECEVIGTECYGGWKEYIRLLRVCNSDTCSYVDQAKSADSYVDRAKSAVCTKNNFMYFKTCLWNC